MSFADVVGHKPVIRLLKGQIAQDRLAHTYLFVGPEGIGKQALAVAFAQELGCSPHDLLIVTPELESGDIRIDQIRTMEGWMNLTPFSGQWKVAILDPADQLTEESTHACLKILEEPPARSIFILLARAPHRLPATLLSRCHRVRCSPQGIERTAAYLQEKENLDPAAARMLAICSGGRLGMALQFHKGDRLTARNEALDLILSALKKRELETPLSKKSRDEIEEYVEWYASWWRDLLVLSVGGNPDWVIHRDRLEDLKKLVIASPLPGWQAGVGAKQSPCDLEEILRQVDRAYRVQGAVQRNASVKSALTVLLSHG